MAALTSTMPVVTMAAFLLVIVAAMAVQTTATWPAADGYTAASTTAKPAEDGYAGGAATTTDKPVEQSTGGEGTTTKPAEDGYTGAATTKSAEKTSGEATVATTTANPAKEGYVAATNKPVTEQTDGEAAKTTTDNVTKITKTANKYAQEASTVTSPEKAATNKKVTGLFSDMAQKAMDSNTTAMDNGAYYVSEKEVEAVSDGVRDTMQQLVDSGEKGSDAYGSLVKANTLLRLAGESLKNSNTATSPEKIVACKGEANDYFITALRFIARSCDPVKGVSVVIGGTVDVKPATKQATEVVAQPASDAYAAKVDVAPKEEAGKQPAVDAYAPKEETSPKEEAGKQPATDTYART